MNQVRLEADRLYVLTSSREILECEVEGLRAWWRRIWAARPNGPLVILGPGWSLAPLAVLPPEPPPPHGWDTLGNVR